MSGPKLLPVASVAAATAAADRFELLPATGVALGLYVAIALACIVAGTVMTRIGRRSSRRQR